MNCCRNYWCTGMRLEQYCDVYFHNPNAEIPTFASHGMGLPRLTSWCSVSPTSLDIGPTIFMFGLWQCDDIKKALQSRTSQRRPQRDGAKDERSAIQKSIYLAWSGRSYPFNRHPLDLRPSLQFSITSSPPGCNKIPQFSNVFWTWRALARDASGDTPHKAAMEVAKL